MFEVGVSINRVPLDTSDTSAICEDCMVQKDRDAKMLVYRFQRRTMVP